MLRFTANTHTLSSVQTIQSSESYTKRVHIERFSLFLFNAINRRGWTILKYLHYLRDLEENACSKYNLACVKNLPETCVRSDLAIKSGNHPLPSLN